MVCGALHWLTVPPTNCAIMIPCDAASVTHPHQAESTTTELLCSQPDRITQARTLSPTICNKYTPTFCTNPTVVIERSRASREPQLQLHLVYVTKNSGVGYQKLAGNGKRFQTIWTSIKQYNCDVSSLAVVVTYTRCTCS